MKAEDADVVWFPKRGKSDGWATASVRIEKHGTGWSRESGDYWTPATSWGAMRNIEAKTPVEQRLAVFVLFNTLVVRDGLDPATVHKAFLMIDEYRDTISPDSPGIEQ